MRRLIFGVLGALTVVVTALVNPGQAHAELLTRLFWGTGFEAGVTVEARIDGKACGASVTDETTEWVVIVGGSSPCAPEVGDTVEFFVDGAKANETVVLPDGGTTDQLVKEVTLTLPGNLSPSLTLFAGGSVEELSSTLRQLRGVSIWATVDGRVVGYTIGAPAFVNSAFMATFPGGVLPANTPLIVMQRADSAPLPAALRLRADTFYLLDDLETGLPNDFFFLGFQDTDPGYLFQFTSPFGFTFAPNNAGEDSFIRLAFDYDHDQWGEIAIILIGDRVVIQRKDSEQAPTVTLGELPLVGAEGEAAFFVQIPHEYLPAGDPDMWVVSVVAFEPICDQTGCLSQLADWLPDNESLAIRLHLP